MKITDKDISIYNFIREYAVEHGYLPSVQDICDGMDYKSTSTVWTHLAKLEAYGYIQKRRPDGCQYSVKGLKYVIERGT